MIAKRCLELPDSVRTHPSVPPREKVCGTDGMGTKSPIPSIRIHSCRVRTGTDGYGGYGRNLEKGFFLVQECLKQPPKWLCAGAGGHAWPSRFAGAGGRPGAL